MKAGFPFSNELDPIMGRRVIGNQASKDSGISHLDLLKSLPAVWMSVSPGPYDEP